MHGQGTRQDSQGLSFSDVPGGLPPQTEMTVGFPFQQGCKAWEKMLAEVQGVGGGKGIVIVFFWTRISLKGLAENFLTCIISILVYCASETKTHPKPHSQAPSSSPPQPNIHIQ